MIDRILLGKIKKSKKSILILGPRQVGKSTLVKSLKPDLIINLARENEYLKYTSDPNLFIEQIETNKYETIFIDEIQRIPSLLNSIQALIDDKGNRQLQFLITGSSARKLKRGQANLLPGRILAYQMSGLCAQELNYKLDFNRCLKYGFLPEPFHLKNNEEVEKLLETYSATYLKEEIQAEALSRNIQGFARFLVNIANRAGQILDFSKLATKAKVSRTSCVRFIEILEDTLIAERIHSYQDIETADTVKHPKIYFFDTGVLNGLVNDFSISEKRKGFLFENLIYTQLKNSALANDIPIKIEYFRTRHGIEVDFIIKIKNKTWAIEAKSGEFNAQDLNGLKALQQYSSEIDYYVLVTPNEKKRIKEGILICDWISLLKEMGF